MYVVSPYVDSLWTYDTIAGAVQMPGTVVQTINNDSTITGFNGLVHNPCTGEFFTIAKVSGVTGRIFGRLNVNTGIFTTIGNTGDNVAQISMINDTLFAAVTGDGGTASETLHFLDPSTGALTLVTALGAGSDGECIGYCPEDTAIYHWSGRDTAPAMDRITFASGNFTGPATVTPVTRTGYNYDEPHGVTYIGNGEFLMANLDQEFIIIDTSGFATLQTYAVHNYYKGLAYGSTPSVWVAGADSICPYGDSTLMIASSADAYQWYLDGSAIAGATADSIYGIATGAYMCELTKGACTSFAPDTLNIFLYPYDAADVTPLMAGFCAGDSVMLAGNTLGGASEWWYGGAMVGSSTDLYATSAGTYTYILYESTGANGCYDMIDVPVMEYALPTSSSTTTDEMLGNDGTIDLTITGTASPFIIDWDNDGTGDNDDTEDLSGLTAGTYIVVVTDTNGCMTTETVIVGSQVGLDEFTAQTGLNIFPNPNNGIFSVEITNMPEATVTMQIVNAAGQVVTSNSFTSNTLDVNIQEFGAGIYTMVLTDGTLRTAKQIIVK
jgi:hypothetical protein